MSVGHDDNDYERCTSEDMDPEYLGYHPAQFPNRVSVKTQNTLEFQMDDSGFCLALAAALPANRG